MVKSQHGLTIGLPIKYAKNVINLQLNLQLKLTELRRTSTTFNYSPDDSRGSKAFSGVCVCLFAR